MKNRMLAIALGALVLLGVGGCALFETEYTYSEPYVGSLERDTGDATEVRNYSMLKAAILDMINNHQATAEFRFSNYTGAVSDDLAAVCLEIKTTNPLGAFAVDTLSYDSSRIVAYYIAEVEITYKKSAEQIRGIRSINSAAELQDYLHAIITGSLPAATIRSYWPQTDTVDIERLVEQICLEDPVGIPLPVTAAIRSYPHEGSNRIFELSLNYLLSPVRRESMSARLGERIEELLAEPMPQEPARLALFLAERLNESLTASAGVYGNTAYGALIDHGADSRGIALAYGALCRAAGLECLVVKGGIGTMGTEEHYWNILGLDGAYYHVDVSQFVFGPAYAFLIRDDSLWGTYIWDTEAYPACSGPLRYADVAPQSEEETEAPAEGDAAPPPSEPPEESPLPPEETGEIIP